MLAWQVQRPRAAQRGWPCWAPWAGVGRPGPEAVCRRFGSQEFKAKEVSVDFEPETKS